MHQQSRSLLVIGLVLLLRSLVVLCVPTPVAAQTAPNLVVTLRDGAGAGIGAATITVRDRDGTSVLALAQTDTSGTATIPMVQMSDVQVAVSGKTSNGTSLKHLDTDTEGIALFLDGARTTQLDLRVEDDGTVIPDPQAMSEPETGLPTVAPTVLMVIAPTSGGVVATVLPTASLLVIASPVSAGTLAPNPQRVSSSADWLVVFVILSLVLVAVVAQLGTHLWRNWRSQ